MTLGRFLEEPSSALAETLPECSGSCPCEVMNEKSVEPTNPESITQNSNQVPPLNFPKMDSTLFEIQKSTSVGGPNVPAAAPAAGVQGDPNRGSARSLPNVKLRSAPEGDRTSLRRPLRGAWGACRATGILVRPVPPQSCSKLPLKKTDFR